MQTKCPSCQNAVQFEAPANVPAGYKHRIYCPYCNAVISVRMPSNTVNAVQPQPAPQPVNQQQQGGWTAQNNAPKQNSYAVQPAPVATPQSSGVYSPSVEEDSAPAGKPKYKGRARSLMMLILALVMFGMSLVGSMLNGFFGGDPVFEMPADNEILVMVDETCGSLDGLNVIYALTQEGGMDALSLAFEANPMFAIGAIIMPVAFFLFSAIWLLISLIGFLAGKYGKTFHMIWTVFLFVFAAFMFIYPMFVFEVGFGDYFKAIFESNWMSIVPTAIGLVSVIFGIIFCAVKKKVKQPKQPKIA